MVVALIALFVALGGSGYAAIQFKKNSIPGKALKRNSVTGKQVKESSLKTVPRAPSASEGKPSPAARSTRAGRLAVPKPNERWLFARGNGDTSFCNGWRGRLTNSA